MYIIRLDDASEYMDIVKWKRMEELLNKYDVKPIFGIIPANEDPELLKYGKVDDFWGLMTTWIEKGWVPALHGYSHVFETNEGGINPVNKRSEFAGVPLERQKEKISEGTRILMEHAITPCVFFAPAHTFDANTIRALKEASNIRIVSDTIAYDMYKGEDGITYIPQQSGRVRKLPFKTVTFCYHPNLMNDEAFENLEQFIEENRDSFSDLSIENVTRRKNMLDKMLNWLYFLRK